MSVQGSKHKPTDETRQTVQIHATIGTPQTVISDILNIDVKTLTKYYRPELETSRAKANAVVGGHLFNKAKGGDTAAQIFWMKTRAGWKEQHGVEMYGPDKGPIQTMDVTPGEKVKARINEIEKRIGAVGGTAQE